MPACTDNFDKINSDPNKVNEITPGYLLTRVWMRYNGSPHEEHRGNLIMAGPLSGITQCGYRTGQAFSGNTDDYNEAKMVEMYNDAVKNGVQLISLLKQDKNADNTAKIAISTITMQFVFQRITDLYGDIPYHQAGLGYQASIFYPKYDSQEDIYKSSVDSLKKYRDILLTTTSAPFAPQHDIIFGGIADNSGRNKAWAKTANSLILRLGMNASAADEAWAKATVEEAVKSPAGLITSYDKTDAAIMPTGDVGGDWGLIINSAASIISNSGGYVFVGDQWLRMAQRNRDPRIFYVAAQVVNEGSRYSVWTGQPDFDAFAEAARPGEPWKPVTFNTLRGGGTESFSVRGQVIKRKANGTTERVFGQWFIDPNASDKFNEYFTMASLNPETIGNREAPIIIFGGDETYYILAEAAQRGWAVTGNAKDNLQKAIELSLAKYPKLFNFGTSVQKYLTKQSAHEGTTLSYDGLAQNYVTKVMSENVDLEVIWRERWKSLLTAQTYDAFTLWNRTNLAVTPQGISYPGTEKMAIPVYDETDLNPNNFVLGQALPTTTYSQEPFHNGGDTEGIRPRRINYPNRERTNNGKNVEAAMQHQITAYGQKGKHFVTTYMWISKKN